MNDNLHLYNYGDNIAIGCILVNYRSPLEMLERCLASLMEADGQTLNVVMVDNSPGDGVARKAAQRFPGLNVIESATNVGFAAAVNRGLAEIQEPLVLLLNTDAMMSPGALESMVSVLSDSPPVVAGVAPKMLLSSHPSLIDAVGTVMPRTGASFNRGIGQCDIGQYDRAEEVAGVCFGAALLRRALFDPDQVGPLNEDYFLYFEDSDWCMRAVSQGYNFRTVPDSVVLHMHSGITRHESLEFKYRLIELNTLKIVTRTFESPVLAARVVFSRCARLLARSFIRRAFVRQNLSALLSFLLALPGLISERRQLKRRRIVSDAKIFGLAAGERAYFDTVSYQPDRCLDSLIDSYSRLLRLRPEPATSKLLAALYRLRAGQLGDSPPPPDRATLQAFESENECVRSLISMSTGAGTE